mmetsp:Transcript_25719/g.66213  ORF Transcript_25719/g.66213 Transcript_25719/m.66213 type:complete len:473 (+) Transcript_25719:183-1601(+)
MPVGIPSADVAAEPAGAVSQVHSSGTDSADEEVDLSSCAGSVGMATAAVENDPTSSEQCATLENQAATLTAESGGSSAASSVDRSLVHQVKTVQPEPLSNDEPSPEVNSKSDIRPATQAVSRERSSGEFFVGEGYFKVFGGCQHGEPHSAMQNSYRDSVPAAPTVSPSASLFSGSEEERDVSAHVCLTNHGFEHGNNSESLSPAQSDVASFCEEPLSLATGCVFNGHVEPSSTPDIDEVKYCGDIEWNSRQKHFFVLSNAGKPIFSRHGSAASLAGFMGVICGMLSFMETTGDDMQSMRAGRHSFVSISRGPLFLVAVSRSAEPVKCLLLQLELLHLSIIGILTNAVQRIFLRSPSYDMRQLMGGTGAVLHSLIHAFSRDPAAMLVSIPSMPLPPLQRRILQDALSGACGPGLAMYGILLAGSNVVGLVEPKGAPMHPHDVLLVSNFVTSNESFRYDLAAHITKSTLTGLEL